MSVPVKPQQPTPEMPKDAGKLRRAWQTLLIIAVCLPTLFLIAGAHSASGLAVGGQETFVTGSRIHLPLVPNTGDFYRNQPIWSENSQAGTHQVVLFRLEFDLPQTLSEVELRLFADTRYQAWLDGVWVGRGPARFALTLRQYDVYTHDSLAPGSHVLAVLAQWSPDDRRSESLVPLLQGDLQGKLLDGSVFTLRTGEQWQVLSIPAWRSDAALIHQWNLIGYSELLDLGQLPAGWNQPGFPAADWPQASVVDLSTLLLSPIRYTPRDIDFPINEAVPAALIDSGTLLPGRALGELPAGTTSPYNLPFQAQTFTPFTIETLGAGLAPAETLILLDSSTLTWQPAGPMRPDVYLAQADLPAGAHTLTFNPPAEGLTFALSTSSLSGLNVPFEQGNHAGRRLLLAEPVSQSGVVIANPGELASLEFTQLPAYAVLDLGRVTHGRITAQVSGPAGTVIDIGWDERLLEGTSRPLPYPGSRHSQWNQTDSWILDGTTRQLTTIDARSGRYILIAVWGSGPLRLDELVISSEHYPLTQIGAFHSSDPLLEQIWQIGADTVQLNMVDAYTDPWRERGQWWGDSFVIDQVNAVAFGNASLLRRGLLMMENAFPETQAPGCAPHNNNLHILDYAMLWVHSLSDYARRTGDLALLYETYPTLQAFILHLESYQNPETGLLDLPYTTWAETAYIDTLGYASRYGQSTALNAMYAATLTKAAAIAVQVGDLTNHDLWQAQAAAVQAGLNTYLYLPEQGRYLTNFFAGAPYPPTLYAQAWPLAYDLVPESEQERVVSALLELLSADPAAPNVGTYGFYWILEGLGQAGYTDQALGLIKSYYGRMIDRGATTWWENFLADQNYSQALSHGWGSAPTWFLTTYILGARQLAPDAWALAPAIHTLDDASGILPLPQGELQISWQSSGCTNGESSRLTHLVLNAPPDTHGQFTLPSDLAVAWITLDGIGIPPNHAASTENPGGISILLDAGSHIIEIGTICAVLP